MKNKLKISGRIWIDNKGINLAGAGKLRLLQKIKELGSLRKAANEMEMSYRHAWGQIDKMNKSSEKPLVILKRGGKEGQTAEITQFGEMILESFEKLQDNFNEFLEKQSKIFNEIIEDLK
jgi:molybdate transport system regulatory protein